MSGGLPEFLLARIGEDEAVARAATPGPWRWAEDPKDGMQSETVRTHFDDDDPTSESWPTDVIYATGMHTEGFVRVEPGDREHIARHDPARVLAECEAKRRMVEMIPGMPADWDDRDYLLRLLALPYADHPDYDPEWKP